MEATSAAGDVVVGEGGLVIPAEIEAETETERNSVIEETRYTGMSAREAESEIGIETENVTVTGIGTVNGIVTGTATATAIVIEKGIVIGRETAIGTGATEMGTGLVGNRLVEAGRHHSETSAIASLWESMPKDQGEGHAMGVLPRLVPHHPIPNLACHNIEPGLAREAEEGVVEIGRIGVEQEHHFTTTTMAHGVTLKMAEMHGGSVNGTIAIKATATAT